MPQDKGEPPNRLPEEPDQPKRAWWDVADRTLAGLGLDVEGAVSDSTRLLPAKVRKFAGERKWPVPREKDDLEAVARLYAPKHSPEWTYIRRCRYALERWGLTKKVRKVKYDRSRLVLKEVEAIVKAGEQAKEELAKVQAAVAVVRTTLLETSQEFDLGFGMIARAFNRKEILPNGEVVTTKMLISAYKNFYDHMHKLGGPITDEMAEEAEEAVFAKAMEASRERIQRTLRTAIPVSATEVAQNATNSTPGVGGSLGLVAGNGSGVAG